MKKAKRTLACIISVMVLAGSAYGQEEAGGGAAAEEAPTQSPTTTASQRSMRDKETVDIFLDDEKLSVEADIPSVDLVMSYKGLGYESQSFKKSFLSQIVQSSKKEPF